MGFLTCPHGHGLWHWIVDIGMTVPFIMVGWFWLKSKFVGSKTKEEHEDG